MPDVDRDAGLVTNMEARASEFMDAANAYIELLESGQATPADIGRGFGDYTAAFAHFMSEIGEGYKEDAENVADMVGGDGVRGELVEGSAAVLGAAAEGFTQTAMTLAGAAFAMEGEMIGLGMEIRAGLDEAVNQLQAGHPDDAMHTLVSIGYSAFDGVSDFAAVGVVGLINTGLEAVAGAFETAYEAGEMAAEVSAAGVDALKEAFGGDVPLFSDVQAQVTDPPAESTPEINMEQEAQRAPVVTPLMSPETVNMEAEANAQQVNMVEVQAVEPEVDPGYNEDWGG